MSAPINHWKLGLFVVITVGAVIAAVIAAGETSAHHATVSFVTYFDESVSGLDSGARVAFRGVEVGTVSRISIAPDHRHVEVTYGLDQDALARMGIAPSQSDHAKRYTPPPQLRAQIGGNGLTGVRDVSLDLVDPEASPQPVLPFAVSSNCIPAETSTLKGIEDALTKAAGDVPGTLARMNRVLDLLNGERGLVARAERATDAFGQVGRGVSGSTRDLGQALDELRDAAEAIRVLAEDLDRDPDMLLKGRPSRGRPR